MKRVLFFLLALVTVLGLVACGNEVKVIERKDGGASENSGASVPAAAEGSVDGYCFKTEGLTVYVDALAETILKTLGEPKQYYEAASCAFEGMDKMYTYEHFEIDTYPATDGERVLAICLMDDLAATPEGLRIGDSRAKVEELYGKDCEVVGTENVYAKGGMKLKVMIENDAVTYITYQSCISGDLD